MAYVNREDYVSMMGVDPKQVPENFDHLAALADQYLDEQTRDFYQRNDITADPWPLRAKKFKRAVAMQIAYMADSGISTAEQAMRQPISGTKTIGRTTVTQTWATNQTAVDGQTKSVISADALAALGGTGLLYRGVDYVR
jgi:hypothetical protein